MKKFIRYGLPSKHNFYNIKYSQNFIKHNTLARETVELADIRADDTVIEIGPGKGSLTEYLLKKSRNVIAIEQDKELYWRLINKFKDHKNIKLINTDFLKYDLPNNTNNKIVGNIPFALTSEIIHKVLNSTPKQISLILQKEAALRLLGSSYEGNSENLYSLRFKPWYEMSIIKYFNKTDFYPIPSVDIVMVNIIRRNLPCVLQEDKDKYLDFITYCFTSWKKDLRAALKVVFTTKQLGYIQRSYKINLNNRPSEVNFEQWVCLFNSYKNYACIKKKTLVKDAYVKVNAQQKKLLKRKRTIIRKLVHNDM